MIRTIKPARLTVPSASPFSPDSSNYVSEELDFSMGDLASGIVSAPTAIQLSLFVDK